METPEPWIFILSQLIIQSILIHFIHYLNFQFQPLNFFCLTFQHSSCFRFSFFLFMSPRIKYFFKYSVSFSSKQNRSQSKDFRFILLLEYYCVQTLSRDSHTPKFLFSPKTCLVRCLLLSVTFLCSLAPDCQDTFQSRAITTLLLQKPPPLRTEL